MPVSQTTKQQFQDLSIPNVFALPLTNASQVVFTGDPERKGYIFFNNSDRKAIITFGPTSSPSLFTYILNPKTAVREMDTKVYTGTVSVISETGVSGDLLVTELFI